MGGPSDTGTIDFPSGDGHDSGREVEAETTVSAAAVAFNSAALPPDMPDWLKATIRAEASAIIENLRDDEIRPTDAKRQEEDAQDNQLQNMLARENAWDQSRVEIGSVSMSGQEWDDAYDLLSDPEMRSQLIDGMVRKKGWSKDRAEKAANDALTLAQIAQRKKDGTMTPEDEAQADEITSRNPDAAVMEKEAARAYQQWGMGTDAARSAPAESTLSGDLVSTAKAQQDTVKNMEADSDEAFATAPSLAAHFDAARSEPLASETNDPPVKPLTPRPLAHVDIGGPY